MAGLVHFLRQSGTHRSFWCKSRAIVQRVRAAITLS